MVTLHKLCSILMAALFLGSASVQFNDQDWYFWIPLYCNAAYVNLTSSFTSVVSTNRIAVTGKVTVWLGIFLLTKVVFENYLGGDMFGIWSLDMRHKLVREKLGSGFVICSMILQLISMDQYTNTTTTKLRSHVEYGMALLVGISYGLSLVFFRVS